MTISWVKLHPDMEFSSLIGFDSDGNQYCMPANKETCNVIMKDGRSGSGWTAEAALEEAKSKRFFDYTFTIYQLGPDSDRFKRWEPLPEGVTTVNLEDDKYFQVYSSTIRGADEGHALEKIYYIFNMARPADFRGHSLSISDIVKLNENYYFCQSVGFIKISVD